MKKFFIYTALFLCLLPSCRKDDVVPPSEEVPTGDTTAIPSDTIQKQIVGMYLLNEGNMGSNKATLDYYDFASGIYTRNIYSAMNPSVAQSLGDVGNDLEIYGNRMYAVINASNFVEVMTADSAKHIGSIQVPNCRYLCFKDGFGYITSFAGPISFDPEAQQIGYVAKFDTATLQIVDTCHVGFQPEELAIVGEKLYVANSGGYMVPNYEHTVSVIDLNTFRESTRIDVAVNLHRLRADQYGNLWVSSRGDYYDEPSRLYCIDPKSDEVIDEIDILVSGMCIDGDSLYSYSSGFSYITMEDEVIFHIVDIRTHKVVADRFITEEVEVQVPYGLLVHPVTKAIFLTDAGDYVTPGTLHCFDKDGTLKWSVRTGDIPAHMVFLYK